MKTVLLLGNLDSIYVQGFIANILKPLDFKVYMLSADTLSQKDYCNKNDISLLIKWNKKYYSLLAKYDNKFCAWLLKICKRIGLIYHYVLMTNKNRIPSFDYINIQFVEKKALLFANHIASSETKTIGTYWGSDLLGQKKSYLLSLRKYVSKLDYITTDSIDLEDAFLNTYGRTNSVENRMKRIYWGSNVAKIILNDVLNDRKYELRELWNIPTEAIVIGVGYNGLREQQHKQVLRELSKISCDNIIVLLQMTYGMDKLYCAEILKECELLGVPCKIITGFLSDEEIAQIRVIVDIYINARKTDAFCSSVKEYLCADTYLVNAGWLDYKELSEWGIVYDTFASFDEICHILEDRINNNNDNILIHNREIVKDKLDWNKCLQDWTGVYSSMNLS